MKILVQGVTREEQNIISNTLHPNRFVLKSPILWGYTEREFSEVYEKLRDVIGRAEIVDLHMNSEDLRLLSLALRAGMHFLITWRSIGVQYQVQQGTLPSSADDISPKQHEENQRIELYSTLIEKIDSLL